MSEKNIPTSEVISQRLEHVRNRIAKAALASNRSPDEIRLLAVSKTFNVDHVRAAAIAGQVEFGENRVQEAEYKIKATRDLSLRWHLIGHIQSNKAKKAAKLFNSIHSVDRIDTVQKLETGVPASGSKLELFVQVDLAGETTKHGAKEREIREVLDYANSCSNLSVVGLMLLPPFSENPEDARPFFHRLRSLRDNLIQDGYDPSQLRELSMGMSNDFEIAIQEGATIVRVGSAIFGKRHQ